MAPRLAIEYQPSFPGKKKSARPFRRDISPADARRIVEASSITAAFTLQRQHRNARARHADRIMAPSHRDAIRNYAADIRRRPPATAAHLGFLAYISIYEEHLHLYRVQMTTPNAIISPKFLAFD